MGARQGHCLIVAGAINSAGSALILSVIMSDLLDAAARRASCYLESLDTRSVAPAKEAIAALTNFERAFPEHTSTAEAVLAELDEIGSPATMASAGGRIFWFVDCGSRPRSGA